MLRYPRMKMRPPGFRLNPEWPLYGSIVSAWLPDPNMVGSTDYHDAVGRNPGTLTGYTGAGDTPADRWKFDPAMNRWVLSCDGTDDYVVCNPVNVPTGSRFTVMAWAKFTTGNAGTAEPICAGAAVADSGSFSLYAYGSASFYFDIGSTHVAYVSSGTSVTTWNCWTGIWDGVGHLYRNGVLLAENSNAATYSYSTKPTWIGRRSTTGFCNGLLGDVLVVRQADVGLLGLANPSNLDLRLGGVPLILPPARSLWPASTTAPTNAIAACVQRRRQLQGAA